MNKCVKHLQSITAKTEPVSGGDVLKSALDTAIDKDERLKPSYKPDNRMLYNTAHMTKAERQTQQRLLKNNSHFKREFEAQKIKRTSKEHVERKLANQNRPKLVVDWDTPII